MPLYFRKSIGKGPFRLNLSSKGLGLSVGIRGLRLGKGPRGTYIRAGREGFTYQKYLSPSAPGNISKKPITANINNTNQLQQIDLSSVSEDEVISAWQEAHATRYFGKYIIAIAIIISLFLLRSPYLLLIPICAIAYGIFKVIQENQQRCISVHYDLDEKALDTYDQLCSVMRESSQSAKIWNVIRSDIHGDVKHNAGTTTGIIRAECAITFHAIQFFKTNLTPPHIDLQGLSVVFLPDKILYLSRAGVTSQPYSKTTFTDSIIDFREEFKVASDSIQVNTTWQYPNKDGGPDKRFLNNKQIAIFRYSELTIKNDAIRLTLQFSRPNDASQLSSALNSIAAPITSTNHYEKTSETKTTQVQRVIDALNTIVPSHMAYLKQIVNVDNKTRVLSTTKSITAFSDTIEDLKKIEKDILNIVTHDLNICLEAEELSRDSAVIEWASKINYAFGLLTAWKGTLCKIHFNPNIQPAVAELALVADEFGENIESIARQLQDILNGSGDKVSIELKSDHIEKSSALLISMTKPISG